MDKILLLTSAIASFVILAMMYFIDPSEVGPLVVLVFFALIYVLFVGLAVFGCKLFFSFRAKLDRTKNDQISRKSYYYGIVIALAPVLLLLCRSFSGLYFVDVVIVVLLEIFLCFLVSKNIL